MRYAIFIVVSVVLAMLWISQGRRGMSATTPELSRPTDPAKVQTAIFAAGCFWGVEERFRHVPGVVKTEAGYIGGKIPNPTYEDVCTHTTGYAEAVRVSYDPAQVSYAELLDTFWTIHDPTTKDRQGPDWGSNYRSAIFYLNADQEKTAKASLAEVDASHIFDAKIVTEIVPATPFYRAEEYHQQYMEKNGGTCHNGIATVKTKLAAAAKAERQQAAASK